jgi:transposase
MLIIGCDYHPGFQQIAFVDTDTGDCGERRLEHMEGAEQFYRDLCARGITTRIGLEASGYSRWFERLISELGFELWVGDAAAISTKRVRKHKTDKQDAELLLRLLMENRFPRIWVPSREERDLRQLLWHRHRLVQMQTRLRNQLRCGCLERGRPAEEAPVAAQGPSATGVASPDAVGQPPSPGFTQTARLGGRDGY